MCGIAGIYHANRETATTAIQRMIDTQSHRGPDDHGTHLHDVGGRVLALGHRRLSIIDTSPLGHQPMVHPQTGDSLVFKGEIYNFAELRDELCRRGARFRGHGD